MRIAIATWSRRRVGGVESYLSGLIPALSGAGHTVSLWYETDEPAGRELIHPTDTFLLDGGGVAALRTWAPDVVFGHGLQDPALEAALLDVAPAVFFAHNYYGTCISGTKTWQSVNQPCSRRLGWPCLVHYYPHRCGGLNPVTMIEDYRRQRERLALLNRYRAILTHSRHMQQEYLNHRLTRTHVIQVTFPSPPSTTPPAPPAPSVDTRHLVFAGRMDRLKGGTFLLDALPQVREGIFGNLKLTFAGDGPERDDWKQRAGEVTRKDPTITVAFPGWLKRPALDQLFDSADLLVLPSIWPEPFGLTGLEAGHRGVPAAAFATGGIPDWLEEGVNGFTAPANPPRAQGLAEAIIRCLEDPALHTKLREGAVRVARRFSMQAHLRDLHAAFERALA